MAKRKSNKLQVGDKISWPDEHVDGLEQTITYTATPLTFSQAAALIGHSRAKDILMGISVACLVFILLVVITLPDMLWLALLLVAISVIFSTVQSRWFNIQLWLAGKSQVAELAEGTRWRILIGTSELVVQKDGSTLRRMKREGAHLHVNEEMLLLKNGSDYVAIPRSAVSQAKFEALTREFS